MTLRIFLTLSTALVLAVLAPAAGLAQDGADAPEAGTAAESLALPDAAVDDHPQVTVTVRAPRSLVGVDVPTDAFTLTEDGAGRAIEAQRLPSDDLEVAVVIDTSGSMGVEPMAAAKAAALDFVQQMPAAVELSVIEFNTEVAIVSDFTTDRAVTTQALDSLAAGGRTALYDAVHTALDLFDGREPARRAVVLLSDGGDNESTAKLNATVDRLEASNATLHIVELVTAEIDADALRSLAAAGDGDVVSADDSQALGAVYEEIASKLVNQYELSYTSEAHGRTLVSVGLEHDGVVAEGSRHVLMPPAPPAPPAPEPTTEETVAPAVPPLRSGDVLRPGLLASSWALYAGAAVFYVALALAILLLLAPRRRRGTIEHAHRGADHGRSALTGVAERATLLADRALGKGERRGRIDRRLEQAGINLRAGEWVVLVGCGAVALGGLGWLAGGVLVALVGTVLAVLLAPFVLSILTSRRQAKFADQLGDTLQLLAGSLRAGYGIMQAVDVVAKEADAPTSEEFQRLLVEARLGRDVHDALHGIAERTGSEDFSWIVQAIDIHREVGGDLAEVLDTVAETIRERGKLHRQVKALSAEGRLSAIILFVLPFFMGGVLWVLNRGYLLELTESMLGYTMLAVGAGLLGVAGVWLRRIIRLQY
jgi:tight adherence protein B